MKINAYLLADWLTIQQPTWSEVLDAVTCGRFEVKEDLPPRSSELENKTLALESVRRICEGAAPHTIAAQAFGVADSALAAAYVVHRER